MALKIVYKFYNWLLKKTSYPGEELEYSRGYWEHLVREKALALCDESCRSLLEVGCGEGLFLKGASVYNPKLKIIGIDISRRMLLKAKQRIQENNLNNINLLQASAYDLPVKDSVFDSVICVNILLNLPSIENVRTTLKEVNRVMKPGGRIIFDFRNKHNFLLRLKYKLAKYYDASIEEQNLPLNSYYYEEIFSILEEAGFEVLRHSRIGSRFKYLAPVIVVEAVSIKDED